MNVVIINCPSLEAVSKLKWQLQLLAQVQGRKDDYDTVQFLLEFYKCFNAFLLRGECTAGAKEFICHQSGWKEPSTATVARQLRTLADQLEGFE